MENAQEIQRSADITLGEIDGIVRDYVVVSAPGGSPKVTDQLMRLAKFNLHEQGGEDTYQNLVARFSGIIRSLQLDESLLGDVETKLNERISHKTPNHLEYIDQVAALGEEVTAVIFAKYLEKRGKKVRVIFPQDIGFFVTETFGDARVLEESYAEMERKIREAKNGYDILVFPGYFGLSKNGKIVTLQRGGSDTVANIVANASNVSLIENWTNTDGVGRLSPLIKKNGADIDIQSIDGMTYEEAVLLSNAGFTVLHPDSIKPARQKSIPIVVRNSRNPSYPGTLIVDDAKPTSLVTGIAYRGGFVSVSYRNPFDIELQSDFITQLRTALSERGIRPSFITSQNGESLIYDGGKLDGIILNEAKRQAIHALKQKRSDVANELDRIELDVAYGVSLVSVVGRGMVYDPESVEAKLFQGIKASWVNARLVSTEPNSRMYLISENPLGKEPLNAIKVAVEMYKQFFPQ